MKVEIEITEDEEGADECPVCGGDMEDGVCTVCGYDGGGSTVMEAYAARKQRMEFEQERDDNGRFAGGGGSNTADAKVIKVGAGNPGVEERQAIGGADRGATKEQAQKMLDSITKETAGKMISGHSASGVPIKTGQTLINGQRVSVRFDDTNNGGKPTFEVGESYEMLRTPEQAMERIMNPDGPHNKLFAARIATVEEAIVTLARSRFFDGKFANETADNQLQHNARMQQKAVRQKAEELRTQIQTTS